MQLLETLSSAKGTVVAITAISGATLGLDNRHAHQSDMDMHMESHSVELILDLVDKAENEGADGWLCRAIEAEFISLCSANPEHYLCLDPETKSELMAKAGC